MSQAIEVIFKAGVIHPLALVVVDENEDWAILRLAKT
jgi:predicted DNA-binding antitoxin AbrB/MazE fold protein